MIKFSIWIFVTVLSFNCFATSGLARPANTSTPELSTTKPVVPKTITSNVTILTKDGTRLLKNVTLTVIGNQAFREGDIFVGYVDESSGKLINQNNSIDNFSVGSKTVSLSNASLRWPDGIVPFVISPFFNLPQATESAITNAMNAISAQSGVQFVDRAGHTDFIEFVPSSSGNCTSPVGKQGGKQTVALASYCQLDNVSSVGTIIHEILHSLGYHHTHNRSDRDSYITVHTSNIQPAFLSNFDKKSASDTSVENFGPYDFASIMHYRRFTSDDQFVFDTSLPMLTVIGSPNMSTRGDTLSLNDSASLKNIYGALPAPYISGLSDFCEGGASIAWSAITNAAEYKIQHFSNGNWNALSATTGTWSFVSVPSSRNIRVLACNSNDECSFSSNVFYVHYYPYCY